MSIIKVKYSDIGSNAKNIIGPIRLSGNDSPTGYHVTASSAYNSTYDVYKAFNGQIDPEHGWAPASAADNNWIKIELPQAKYISFVYINYISNSGGVDLTCTMYGSNDDVNYAMITTVTSADTFSELFERVRLVNANAPYKYYKFVGPFTSVGYGYKIELYTTNSGGDTLKDIMRDKVLNGGFSVEIPLSVASARMTINEGGKIVVDTTNKIAYFYVDMTALSGGASSNWRQYGTFSSDLANYLPKGASNNRNTMTFITNDAASDKKDISFLIGYVSASYPRAFGVGYGVTNIEENDRFYVYGSWSY